LRDRARAVAQMRAIWHCEIFDTTPVLHRKNRCNKLLTDQHLQMIKKSSEVSVSVEQKMCELTLTMKEKIVEKSDYVEHMVEKSQKQQAGLEDRLNRQIQDKFIVVEVLFQSLPAAPTKREVEESIVVAVKDKIDEDKEEEAEIAKRKTSVIVFGLSESHSEDAKESKM